MSSALDPEIARALLRGSVIPACPLALTRDQKPMSAASGLWLAVTWRRALAGLPWVSILRSSRFADPKIGLLRARYWNGRRGNEPRGGSVSRADRKIAGCAAGQAGDERGGVNPAYSGYHAGC